MIAVQVTSSTCNICSTSFENNDEQRAHAKSEWHVYNLKRRIAELPPLSFQNFTEKVIGGQETLNNAIVGRTHQRECVCCDMVYEDLKLYQRHLKSWRHVQRVEESELGKIPDSAGVDVSLEKTLITENQSDSEGESVASVVEHFNPSNCLFCTRNCVTLDDNLQHMQQDHGMFIADREHLVDLETFFGYLFTIITDFNECLHCGHVKSTLEGIRQHRLTKGHCKLRPHDDVEYEGFYEHSDEEDAEVQKNKANTSEEIAKLLDDTEHEAVLRSGRTIGDRSQTRSFTSNFRSRTKPAESQVAIPLGDKEGGTDRPADERRRMIPPGRQLVGRADGGLGMIGVSDLQKRALRAVEKKMLKTEIRARNQYRAIVEKAGNKTMQKHFKPDVPGRFNG